MDDLEGPMTGPGRRARGMRSSILAAGAAFGLTLGGLAVAGAQAPSTSETAPSTAALDEPGGPNRAGRRHHRAHVSLEVAARTIGVTPAELMAARRDGRSIAQVAEAEGVAVQAVIDALVADARQRLAAKVTAGDITQAQADERSADLVERVTDRVNRTDQPGHRGHGRRGPGEHIATAATALGTSEDDLRAALQGGQSIAQVAQSRNVPVQQVIDAIVAEAQANLVDRVTELVNRAGR